MTNEQEVNMKEVAGRKIGMQILSQLDHNPEHLFSRDIDNSWDLDYIAYSLIDLIEIKVRKYSIKDYSAIPYFVIEEKKINNIRNEFMNRKINRFIIMQIFNDGVSIFDATKFILVYDKDYISRKVVERWDRDNGIDSDKIDKDCIMYFRTDMFNSIYEFTGSWSYEEMIDPNFNEKYINIIKERSNPFNI